MEFLYTHYLAIKNLHILTAVVSITLFTLRFGLLMTRPSMLGARWIKRVPHLNDSALLLFAILLCVITQQAPVVTPWLSEKVAAVLVYILAGMFALKWAKSRRGQIIWFIIAISMFAFTLTTAFNKNPLIF